MSKLDKFLVSVCFVFGLFFALALTGCASKPRRTFQSEHGGRAYSEYHGAPKDFRGNW